MKTVIMAGGKGTRISSVASDIPKPMIKIEGKAHIWMLSTSAHTIRIRDMKGSAQN